MSSATDGAMATTMTDEGEAPNPAPKASMGHVERGEPGTAISVTLPAQTARQSIRTGS